MIQEKQIGEIRQSELFYFISMYVYVSMSLCVRHMYVVPIEARKGF